MNFNMHDRAFSQLGLDGGMHSLSALVLCK